MRALLAFKVGSSFVGRFVLRFSNRSCNPVHLILTPRPNIRHSPLWYIVVCREYSIFEEGGWV